MELLARASVGDSTQKGYGQKWRAWCYARAAHEKSPWLLKTDGAEAAAVALTEFMALRCFTFKNQSTTIRGYLSAIKYYHKMFGGWELPTDHHMVVAVGRGIDRAHGGSDVRPEVRCLGYSVLDAGLSCTKGVWYIYDWDTGSSILI